MNLECIHHLQHQKESWRRAVRLLVFLLRQLPVSHDIPHNLVLINGRFLKFLVLKVDDLEKPEHIRFHSLAIDAKFLNNFCLDIPESVIGLHLHQNAITNRKVNWNGNLPFAHQSHQLIFYRHVAYRWRIVYSSQHLPEEVSKVFLLFI